MRIALIGYGAVAAIHARAVLASKGSALATIIGPDLARAQAFAETHGAAGACTDIEQGLADVDAAIIASPSALHFEQAQACLERGRHALIELPAVQSLAQAEQLADTAAAHGCVLQCATTSRFMRPYQMVGRWLAEGRLGELRNLQYWRAIAPRKRSWIDDALLHHGEHPLDLMLQWFGDLTPLGCTALPHVVGAQELALIARLPNGAPVSMAITYHGRLPGVELKLIGEDHTLVTDGSSYIRCDDAQMGWQGDGEAEFADAISRQDQAFVNTCQEPGTARQWPEMLRLIASVEAFRRLGGAA
jgi:2-hydroxy-4-carboxymuconate semialdehyde hemiacetal dehydrogenase